MPRRQSARESRATGSTSGTDGVRDRVAAAGDAGGAVGASAENGCRSFTLKTRFGWLLDGLKRGFGCPPPPALERYFAGVGLSDSARSSMPRPRGGGEPPPIGLDAFIWLGVLLLLEAGGCAEAGRRRLGGCWPLALAAEVGVHVALAALVGRWRARGCGGGGSWAALRLHSGRLLLADAGRLRCCCTGAPPVDRLLRRPPPRPAACRALAARDAFAAGAAATSSRSVRLACRLCKYGRSCCADLLCMPTNRPSDPGLVRLSGVNVACVAAALGYCSGASARGRLRSRRLLVWVLWCWQIGWRWRERPEPVSDRGFGSGLGRRQRIEGWKK